MFFYALTFAGSRGSCLNTRLLGRVLTVYCLLYCFCKEMRSPGGSCFPLCNLLKNSVISGVILKVNMSLFGCKLFSICVSRSQKCQNVHSQGVYLIMS